MAGTARDRFPGKVAFVTGAAGGIGRATALAFAREGASVVVADVDEQANADTARLIEAAGGRVAAVRCDVTRAQDVQAATHATVETFGGLDMAFNNAGIEQSSAPAADITEAEWDRVIAVSLRGVFLSMKHEIPLLLQRGGGAIVNTSSGAGIKGFPAEPPTPRRSSASSAQPSAPHSTTLVPASASTPSAPASSTPT